MTAFHGLRKPRETSALFQTHTLKVSGVAFPATHPTTNQLIRRRAINPAPCFFKELKQANIRSERWGEILSALDSIKGANLTRAQHETILNRIGDDLDLLDNQTADDILCKIQSHEDLFSQPKQQPDSGPAPMDIGAVQTQKQARNQCRPRKPRAGLDDGDDNRCQHFLTF